MKPLDKRPGSSKTGEADPVDCRFRTAAHGDIRFTGTNQPRSIPNRLDPGGARRHRRPQRSFEAMLDRHMTGGEIDQKRRNGEWRQTPRPSTVGGAHRVGDRTETTDTGADDGRRTLLTRRLRRMPSGLLQRLACCLHGKQNEAIHLLLFFGRRGAIRIESGLGVLFQRRHAAADPCRQIGDHRVRQRHANPNVPPTNVARPLRHHCPTETPGPCR